MQSALCTLMHPWPTLVTRADMRCDFHTLFSRCVCANSARLRVGAQVAIAIVVGVLGGLCVLSTCIVLLVRHYCKAELQELMAQRTLRKQAHRQRLAKTDDHLGVANVGVAEEADVEEEAAADPVTASKASAKPDGASPDAARGAAEQVGKKQAEVELQQDMSI